VSPVRRPGRGGFPEYRRRLPGPGSRRAGRRPFGATWWGRAWVEALEQRASLDPNRLPRGRTYARGGAVGTLEISSGEVLAPVQGSRPEPYRVRVRVRTFAEPEWRLVLDALAAQVGHAAALLDGEIVPEVADDARSVGLDLLPGPGDVQPRCNCPDSADPCKHSAAVCYLVADELDRDPFLLFLLRGQSRDQLLAGIRRRRRPDGDAGPPAGDEDAVPLRWEAWARAPAPPGGLPAPPRRPGRPVLLLGPAPAGAEVDADALAALAGDAARRAWALAAGERDTGLDLDPVEDQARWAAALLEGAPAAVDLDELARRSGLTPRELFLHVLAWRAGGRAGLGALLDAWDPEPAALAWARAELGPGSRATRNRVTLGHRQLRLGRDGRWYGYRKVRGSWQPSGVEVRAGDRGTGPARTTDRRVPDGTDLDLMD
jgi:uncharacterized Zn finger protein